MQATLIEQRQAEQLAENDRELGDEGLREWGTMLRVEKWPGPNGSPPCPMFKDMTTRYPETREHETYNADVAGKVLEMIYAADLSDNQETALHLFYADNDTAFNLSKSTERYNKQAKDKDPLTHRGFKRVIDDLCIRLGLLMRVSKTNRISIETKRY